MQDLNPGLARWPPSSLGPALSELHCWLLIAQPQPFPGILSGSVEPSTLPLQGILDSNRLRPPICLNSVVFKNPSSSKPGREKAPEGPRGHCEWLGELGLSS